MLKRHICGRVSLAGNKSVLSIKRLEEYCNICEVIDQNTLHT